MSYQWKGWTIDVNATSWRSVLPNSWPRSILSAGHISTRSGPTSQLPNLPQTCGSMIENRFTGDASLVESICKNSMWDSSDHLAVAQCPSSIECVVELAVSSKDDEGRAKHGNVINVATRRMIPCRNYNSLVVSKCSCAGYKQAYDWFHGQLILNQTGMNDQTHLKWVEKHNS